MKKADRIVSFDWDKYDQANVVYRPAQMSGDELWRGTRAAYETFYALSSLARRFPLRGSRSRLQWLIYNYFFKKDAAMARESPVAQPDGGARHGTGATDPAPGSGVAPGDPRSRRRSRGVAPRPRALDASQHALGLGNF